MTACKSSATDAGHARRDGHQGQAATVIKSTATNAGHARRDGHRGQAAAPLKSTAADAGHRIRYDSIFATCYQCIIRNSYNGIAITTRIVNPVLGIYVNRGQAAAVFKSCAADAGHALRDGHRGQAAAPPKS